MSANEDERYEEEMLSSALQEWQVTAELPSDFKRSMWNRISSVESNNRVSDFRPLIELNLALSIRRSVVLGYMGNARLLGAGVGLLSKSHGNKGLQGEEGVEGESGEASPLFYGRTK